MNETNGVSGENGSNKSGNGGQGQKKRNRSRRSRGGGGKAITRGDGKPIEKDLPTPTPRPFSRSVSNTGSEAAPLPKKRRYRGKKVNGNVNDDNVVISDNAPDIPTVDAPKEVIVDPSFITPYHFKSQPPELIHPLTLRAVTEVMKLERLTEVQHKTIQESRSPDGTFNDVLGRARTGTGKTLAFLIPAIQKVLSSSKPDGIQVLVISPTRELATQIMTQADQVLTFHKQLSVQIIMGGTNMKSDISRFNKRLPTILVATPGRMKDHLQNTVLQNEKQFPSSLANLSVLVLDEADQLLEMGFRPDIFTIISYLPSERQTLLFSATMPQDLRDVMAKAMKSNYKTVDCIHDYGDSKETNAHVEQAHVIMPSGMDRLVIGVIEVMLAAMKSPDYKIIAFFPTARLVGYFAELINLGIREQFPKSPFPAIIEIHSRKSQANRNKASDKFRAAKSAILFTSDVSARGVDYPNVSHVIQFGLPDSREQYIHRLGRTGRAGRAGRGWLILADYERTFLKELSKGGSVHVPVDSELEELFSCPPSQEAQDLLTPVLRDQVGSGKNKELVRSAKQAYQSWLGFYKDQTRRMVGNKSKAEMVQMANQFAKLCGLSEQPALLKKTVGKMGLKGVPGLITTNALD